MSSTYSIFAVMLTDPGDALQGEGAQHAHLSTQQYRGQYNWSGEGRTRSHLHFVTKETRCRQTNKRCVHTQLEKELTYDRFVEWTRPDMMDEVEVQVGLPRFKMEENYDMKNILVSMGMVDAFDERLSDFSGRTNSWIIMDQEINTK